jgi:hypothetical protein
VIDTGIPNAVTAKHVFLTKTQTENETALEHAQEELDRLVVLGLVAIFERTLRDHLSALPVVPVVTGIALHDGVRSQIIRDMEFWHIERVLLDTLFATVDTGLKGQVKQIIDFRNWVAHGHTLKQPPPTNISPAEAHKRLTDFLQQAGVMTHNAPEP